MSPLTALLLHWVNINSHSANNQGLKEMQTALIEAFSVLDATPCPLPFPGLSLKKREKAPTQLLFVGHMDTVYPPDSPFQKGEIVSGNRLHGPGAADMKGGLIIMLEVLKTLEAQKTIGWEVIITGDEEVGSPQSAPYLQERAQHHDIGLVFEPALPDGALVGERPGSLNFTVTAHGIAAHAGRHLEEGRNAILALCEKLQEIKGWAKGVSLNIGTIAGGTAVNVVPAEAASCLNVRFHPPHTLEGLQDEICALLTPLNGVTFRYRCDTARPPKPMDEKTKLLFEELQAVDPSLKITPSGGVCDGNTLAAAGLPTLDTLGAVGGKLHSPEEYVLLDSLPERAALISRWLQLK